MTIEQFIKQALKALDASPTPRLDAEVLLMHVTGFTRTQLVTQAHASLLHEQEEKLQALLARRLAGEPVAYLTGRREFWSLDLAVTPDVLIPRPDTELLVEQALARIPADSSWAIADLGTGSGAIALSVARERPRCRIAATDASASALAVARTNARRLGISNVEFIEGDWLVPLAGKSFDLIVSNPPYIPSRNPHLAEGDVRFEPRGALVAGEDGLDAIRIIAAAARARLKPGGWLLLEHGYDQAEAVRRLFASAGLTAITSQRDLGGHERVTAGQRPAAG